jgi:carbon-monoxide dehydrogenase small subunit
MLTPEMQSTVDSTLGKGGFAPGAGGFDVTAHDQAAAQVPGGPASADQAFAGTAVEVTAEINGEPRRFEAAGDTTLLTALRETLALTAAKEGCAQGDCGSCIVVMDGEPVNSCLVLAAEANGSQITTLEGLARGSELHPLQREFTARWAFQCGYCTPGMVMSCFALLSKNVEPTDAEIREAIEGNLCRCTNYRPIVEAVRAAAAELRAGAPDGRDNVRAGE